MIHCSRSLACRAVRIGLCPAAVHVVPSAGARGGPTSGPVPVARGGHRSITQRERDERDSVYAPVPGASSGRTIVFARQDIVCVEDVDVDVDAGVKVESPRVWEMSPLSEDDDDDAVKLEIFDVACEEALGIDCAAPGEDFGFENANRLFGFSFALRTATLLSSSVICYWQYVNKYPGLGPFFFWPMPPTLAYRPRSYLGNPSPKLSTNVLKDDIRLDISVMDVDGCSSKDCSIPN